MNEVEKVLTPAIKDMYSGNLDAPFKKLWRKSQDLADIRAYFLLDESNDGSLKVIITEADAAKENMAAKLAKENKMDLTSPQQVSAGAPSFASGGLAIKDAAVEEIFRVRSQKRESCFQSCPLKERSGNICSEAGPRSRATRVDSSLEITKAERICWQVGRSTPDFGF